MGRWAQYRKRGSTREPVQPPSAPTDSDWSLIWSDFDANAQAQISLPSFPPGAIGCNFWEHADANPFAYADQTFNVGDGMFGPGGQGSASSIFGKIRWIISGAGEGDPDTVYSDFSPIIEISPS